MVMAKALYGVYFIFTLGVVGMGYSFFSASHDVEQDTLACLRLPQTEMGKCMDLMSPRATNLRKTAGIFSGQN